MKELLNKEVGKVQINKPIIYTDRGYECAAWWEERKSDLGVFPLVLVKDRYLDDYSVMAKIPAIVTDDYFPALWGGVPVSNKPYVPKRIGERSSLPVVVRNSLPEAICQTGYSPGNEIDWYINPEIWEMCLKNCQARLIQEKEYLDTVWNVSESHRISSIKCTADRLSKVAKEIDEITFHIKSWKDAFETAEVVSEYRKNLWQNNTKWART